MAEIFFGISILMVFYAYVGYPISLLLLSFFRERRVIKGAFFPKVSIIITVHNEAKRIEKKIENTLRIEYPKDKLQIIVSSDGSTDSTNEIVRQYEDRGILLFTLKERSGKEKAQKEALNIANGDIIIFTDAATMLDPHAVKEIVSNFDDPEVGCVSSEDRIIDAEGKPGQEGMYVKYEMWLRRLESRVNSLVGLSGSFFAARKEVCRDFSGELQSDFRTVLNCIKMGMRGVSDPLAIGYYQDVGDEKKEFDRKVRTVIRGLTVFFRHLEFLNFWKYMLFSYQFLCHKLLRWLVPLFLIIFLISNFFILEKSWVFFVIFFLQLIFYGSAILGIKFYGLASKLFVKIPAYFTVVNASILVAWWRYLKGERVVMWNPSQR